jgi:hypothetical protein
MQDACLTTEHWVIKDQKNPNWLKEFHEFTAHRSQISSSFAQAIQLKRISQVMGNSEFESDFSEYWLARVLYDANLAPLAHRVFQSVFENSGNLELKKAAFTCLARIQMNHPDWSAPDLKQAKDLLWNEADSDILALTLIGKEDHLSQKLAISHRNLVDGINFVKNKKYTDAIVSLENFLKYLETHPSHFLSRYQDQAHLFLGRAYYSVARFKEAENQFQRVKKTSNEQIEALSNLAWAYLLDEKYDDAIGVALQLRTGNLRNTFVPEPMMVAAMALNEICIYPESIRMVQTLVRDYAAIHDWLEKNQNRDDGYNLATQTLKNQSPAPTKLATEWLRAPEFLTRQKEINTLIGQAKLMEMIESQALQEQKRLTKNYLDHTSAFIQEFRIAKLNLKAGQDLPPQWSDRYSTLKKEHRKLSQFYRASKTWKTLARNYNKMIPQFRSQLVKKVGTDIRKKNQKMLALLKSIRSNSDLIEVEIYNGASQDLIWKNAHPGYEPISENLEESKPGADQSKTWSWGHFKTSDLDDSEVWEDELGALKADVQNHCGMKERFLKLNLSKQEG